MDGEELVFLCLGDSLTAGGPGFSGFGTWSGNPKSQYEYWLEKRISGDFPDLDFEVINFGVGGNVVWQMLYRFKNIALEIFDKIDYVIIMGGINDILGHGADENAVWNDLKELYEFADSTGCSVIPMEIAPASVTLTYVNRIKAVNKSIRKYAENRGLYYVPVYNALSSPGGNSLDKKYDIGDGVHFNVEGYKQIGNAVYETAVKKILEKIR